MKRNLKNFGMSALWVLNGVLYLMYVIVCFGKAYNYLSGSEVKENETITTPKMSELRE